MRFFMNWIVSSSAAYGLQRLTDYALPIDIDRIWVILIGGLVGIMWLKLISEPIKEAFR